MVLCCLVEWFDPLLFPIVSCNQMHDNLSDFSIRVIVAFVVVVFVVASLITANNLSVSVHHCLFGRFCP